LFGATRHHDEHGAVALVYVGKDYAKRAIFGLLTSATFAEFS
jgi:hypothetical protein